MLSMLTRERPLACASLEAQRRMQRRELLIRSEIQGVKQLVLGQEVMEGYALVAKGTGPGLGSVGCKPFPSPGGHQDMAVWPSQLQKVGANQVAASPCFSHFETKVPSMGHWVGSLCSALTALTSVLLGNGELIRPATDLPCLIPAEEEPKLLMLQLRLAASTYLLHRSSKAEQVSLCLPAEEQRYSSSSPPHSSAPLLLGGRRDLMKAPS